MLLASYLSDDDWMDDERDNPVRYLRAIKYFIVGTPLSPASEARGAATLWVKTEAAASLNQNLEEDERIDRDAVTLEDGVAYVVGEIVGYYHIGAL